MVPIFGIFLRRSCLYLFLLYWTKHYETVVRFMLFVVFRHTAGIITYFGLSLLNHVTLYKAILRKVVKRCLEYSFLNDLYCT